MGVRLAGIEDILLQDEHIKDIIPAENWEFPDIDYSVFIDEPGARCDINILKRFLACRYVVDDFTDHEKERKPWLNEMYSRHGREFWDYVTIENALKRGNFVHIANGYTPIIDSIEENYAGPGKDRLCLLSLMLKRESMSRMLYDAMPAGIKTMYVKRLKSHVYGILNFLAQDPVAVRKAS